MEQRRGIRAEIDDAFARLARRLDLRFTPAGVEPAELMTAIRLGVSLDALLQQPMIISASTAAQDAAGDLTVYTVPAGQRLWLLAAMFTRSVGSRTIVNWWVNDGTTQMQLQDFSAASTYRTGALGLSLPLEPAWTVGVTMYGGSGSTVFNGYLWVMKEESHLVDASV